ncbi:MAG: hypothetical protein WB759_01230, partial [Methanoregula sp.]
DIAFFGGLYIHGKKDRPSAGCTDAEIAVPLFDIGYDIGCNSDPGNAGRIRRMTGHYAGNIVKGW